MPLHAYDKIRREVIKAADSRGGSAGLEECGTSEAEAHRSIRGVNPLLHYFPCTPLNRGVWDSMRICSNRGGFRGQLHHRALLSVAASLENRLSGRLNILSARSGPDEPSPWRIMRSGWAAVVAALRLLAAKHRQDLSQPLAASRSSMSCVRSCTPNSPRASLRLASQSCRGSSAAVRSPARASRSGTRHLSRRSISRLAECGHVHRPAPRAEVVFT